MRLASTLVKTLNFMKRRGDSVEICKYAIKRKPGSLAVRADTHPLNPLVSFPLNRGVGREIPTRGPRATPGFTDSTTNSKTKDSRAVARILWTTRAFIFVPALFSRRRSAKLSAYRIRQKRCV